MLKREADDPVRLATEVTPFLIQQLHPIQETRQDEVPLGPIVSSSSSSNAARQPRASVQPLAPERYRLQLTLSREGHDKIRRAQAMLRHVIPNGDLAQVVERALTLLVEDLERRRFARVGVPRHDAAAVTGSRGIPAAVRRAVWTRDEGRGAFVGREGRCRAHNQFEGRLVFGEVVREATAPWPGPLQ